MKTVVVKLGGSLISEKSAKEFPLAYEEIEKYADEYIRSDVIKRIGREIEEALAEKQMKIILINGAGPFGHFVVRAYLEHKVEDIMTIHKSVELLNKKLIGSMKGKNLQLYTIHPVKTCKLTKNGFDLSKLFKEINSAKSKIPSTYGDIVPVVGVRGRLGDYDILSGDDIVVEVARYCSADRILMVTDVDGVFTKDPKINRDAKFIRQLTDEKTEVEYSMTVTDVTGGFASKIKKLFVAKQHGIVSQIVNGLTRDNVKKALLGDDSIGTLIV